MGRHSKYPEEFRRESVRLVLTTDKSMAEVSRDLGINYKTLGNWVRAEQARETRDQAPGALSESERAELKRVKKENAELRIELPASEQNLIMHIELPILDGHVLMGTDMLESMGHELRVGNNVTLNLELEDRAETERLFGLLAEGSAEVAPLTDMPWGAYWGCCLDQYDIRWMFNCVEPASS